MLIDFVGMLDLNPCVQTQTESGYELSINQICAFFKVRNQYPVPVALIRIENIAILVPRRANSSVR